MDLQTDAVAETVGEVRPVAGAVISVARRRVDLACRWLRPRRPAGRPAGPRHQPVDLRAASRPAVPSTNVRVMSEWYPSTVAPKSSLRGRRCASSRAVGRWCGIALFAPAATMVSKDGSLAPRWRIRWSRSSPTSRSVRPGRMPPPSISSASARSATAQAVRSASISPGVLDRPQLLDQSAVATSSTSGHRRPELADRAASTETGDGLEADVPEAVGEQRQVAGPVDPPGQVGHLLRGLHVVPPVGAEQWSGLVRLAVARTSARGVRPGEPGQVADVDQVRDQQRIQPGVLQERAQPAPARPRGARGHAAHGRRAPPSTLILRPGCGRRALPLSHTYA